MRSHRRAVIRSRMLAGALAIFLSTGALAAPEITVHPHTLGLPLVAGETVTQSLFLSAAQSGSLTIDSITVEYITGRDESRLSTNAASITDFRSGASGTTIPVSITFRRKEFPYPGTYKIGLRIRGRRSMANAQPVPVDELIELSVKRAVAQITVKISNDARVTVERGKEQQISFSVVQDGGADIGDLKLVQGTVGQSSDNALAPGTIELIPPELMIVGGAVSGILRFSGFSKAGDYKSELSFTSVNLARPVTVPITIRVKDGWVWPFLTTIGGVLGGTLVYVFVHIWRPRQLLAYRLADLQSRLQTLQNAIYEIATKQEYYRLQGRLYSLTQGIDLDLTNDAAVQQAQSDIEALERKIVKVQADADQALKTIAEDLLQARNDLLPFGGTAEGDLKRVQQLIDDCRTRYEEGHAEEAAALIKTTTEDFKHTRLRLAGESLDAMRQEINSLSEPDKCNLTTKAQQAAADLREPGAKIGKILGALRNELNVAKGVPADARLAITRASARPTITVDLAPEYCRAGIPLQFNIAGQHAAIDEVTWSFDGLVRRSKDLPLSYRFTVPAQYLVTAAIKYKDGTFDTALPSRISILPNETQSLAQRIRQRIRDVDVALLIVALILAAVTGLLDRYADKPFGTVTDYCWAFLWGFGIDNVVRGFGATFSRIKS